MFKVILAIGAAVLALLSMPGYLWGGLIFVALVPLLFALDGCSWRQGFWLGYLCGFSFFALLLYWIYALAEWVGAFTLLGHVGLAGVLGLWWGLFGAIRSKLTSHLFQHAPLVLELSCVWVILEYLRSLTRFGFTWGFLSDALYQYPQLIQIASLTGAWGLSLLIVLVNLLIYRALRERRLLYGALAMGLIALDWGWGAYTLSRLPPEGQSLRVALVHSNVPQHARSDPGQLQALQTLYLSQLDELSPRSVDLVLLPESIVPAYLLRQQELLRPYQEQARRLQTSLIIGTIDYRDSKLFNTAALILPDGTVSDLYDKVQLVPFSTEYFPLIELWRGLGVENLVGPLPLGALTPGEEFHPLTLSLSSFRGEKEPKVKVATLICFESIFSQIGRAFVRNGAQALFIITNDAWFKGSKALEQHFAKAVFRAVEARRFTAQSSNGGISGMIDPYGRILAATRSEKEQILQEIVLLQDRATLWVQLGDWVVYLLGILCGGLVLWRFKSHAGV